MKTAKIAKLVQQSTYWPIIALLKAFFGYKVNGQENLKGVGDKSIIFVSNHASLIDGPISAGSMPREGFVPKKFFPIRFLVAKEFFSAKTSPWFFLVSLFTALYVRSNGSIPVVRKTMNLELALRDAIEVFKKEEGVKLWIYPEGRITLDGEIQKGKKGAVYLQEKTGALIVPVKIIGSFKILGFSNILKSLFFLKKRDLTVVIGKPINFPDALSLEEKTAMMMEEIKKLK